MNHTLGVAVLLFGATAALGGMVAVRDGRDVPADQAANRLAESWLEIDLAKGESARLLDLTVQAPQASKAVAGASSEYLFLACLSGQIRAGDQSASAGQVIVWKHDAEFKPVVRRFSARDLAGTLQKHNRPAAAEAAAALADRQRTGRFWGKLRTSNVNVGEPLQPTAEQLRRDYLLQPQVLAIRRQAPEPIPQATARAAAVALQRGDAEALAQLLTPEYFRDPARKDQLNEARLGMAKQLIANAPAKPDPATLSGGRSDEQATGQSFSVKAGDRTVVIRVAPFDSGWFVTGMR